MESLHQLMQYFPYNFLMHCAAVIVPLCNLIKLMHARQKPARLTIILDLSVQLLLFCALIAGCRFLSVLGELCFPNVYQFWLYLQIALALIDLALTICYVSIVYRQFRTR